ncbi:MAG: hypothetical protein LDL44_07830 [Caenispirillum sp.]|nr:hypothetical protein [Caenispirillum sp.]
MDIQIKVVNESDDDAYILFFQKPDLANPNRIYSDVFPVAWRVVPLGHNSTSTIVYPVSLQVTAQEHTPVYNAANRLTYQDTDQGQAWKFITKGDFADIETDGKSDGSEVILRNNAPERIDAGLAKDGKVLLVQRGLGLDEQAVFQLTPKLYVVYTRDIAEGELIKGDTASQHTKEIDLTNLQSITVALVNGTPGTGQKIWELRDRRNV